MYYSIYLCSWSHLLWIHRHNCSCSHQMCWNKSHYHDINLVLFHTHWYLQSKKKRVSYSCTSCCYAAVSYHYSFLDYHLPQSHYYSCIQSSLQCCCRLPVLCHRCAYPGHIHQYLECVSITCECSDVVRWLSIALQWVQTYQHRLCHSLHSQSCTDSHSYPPR